MTMVRGKSDIVNDLHFRDLLYKEYGLMDTGFGAKLPVSTSGFITY